MTIAYWWPGIAAVTACLSVLLFGPTSARAQMSVLGVTSEARAAPQAGTASPAAAPTSDVVIAPASAARGLELVIRSRYRTTFTSFTYEAEVRRIGLGVRSIESVEYQFPATFGQEPVPVTNAASNYRLTREVYGAYTLKARVKLLPSSWLPGALSPSIVLLEARIPAPRPPERSLAPYSFAAFTRPLDHGRFAFRVHLSGLASSRGPVEEVEYTLDPSFDYTVRHVRNASHGFLLADHCSRSFSIGARVLFADGSIARALIPIDTAGPSTLAFRQHAEWQGHGRYRVTIWLEGPQDQLVRVTGVSYVLHPDLERHNTVDDPASGFALTFTCWGEFDAFAVIYTATTRSGWERIPVRLPPRS